MMACFDVGRSDRNPAREDDDRRTRAQRLDRVVAAGRIMPRRPAARWPAREEDVEPSV